MGFAGVPGMCRTKAYTSKADHDELEKMNFGLLLLASMGTFLICFGFSAFW